jgi:hypothetical protein
VIAERERRSNEGAELTPSRLAARRHPPALALTRVPLWAAHRVAARTTTAAGQEHEARQAEHSPFARRRADAMPEVVYVHVGQAAEREARAIGASAFTFGNHIALGHGVTLGTPAGERVLTHELTHVAQQAGREPIVQRRSRASETGDLLEWWDSAADATRALVLLESMSPTDFDDTLGDMLASNQYVRLIGHLPGRPEIVRFLRLVGQHASAAHKDAVMAAYPLANMTPESQLIVYGEQFGGGYGARGPAVPAGARAALVSSNPSAPFTGSGATGVAPRDAPMSLTEMWRMHRQADEARARFGSRGVEHAQYHLEPGLEMLYEWSNPNKGSLTGPGSWLASLSPTTRVDQVKLLLGQEIATHSRGAYSGALPTRLQVVRTAAAAHRLEPELVAAIILAEQRDQSVREDAADYQGAAVGGRSSSIGLGQVTVTTARRENLFADLVSPSMQRWLGTTTPTTTTAIAGLLSSDEFNIFAVARYLRIVADRGARLNIATLPNTRTWVGAIDMSLYGGHSSTWTEDHVRLIGSEYTSTPWDDVLVEGWGEFVREAYRDVKRAALF